MSTYPQNSHFNELYIRKMAGSAMVADAAVFWGGVWSVSDLELLMDGKAYPKQTGKFSNMYDGRILHENTCKRTKIRFCTRKRHGYNFRTWKVTPFWRLLYRVDPKFEDIINALLSIKGETKNLIWEATSKGTQFDAIFSRNKITPELIAAVAEHANFEALVILTAWARQLRKPDFSLLHYHCVKQSRNIFARVVCNTPQLFIRWPVLLQYYIEPVWYIPSGNPFQKLKIYDLEEEMYIEEKKARMQGVLLPPKNIFRQINKKELFLIGNAFKH